VLLLLDCSAPAAATHITDMSASKLSNAPGEGLGCLAKATKHHSRTVTAPDCAAASTQASTRRVCAATAPSPSPLLLPAAAAAAAAS
jgi:hypothetical protein